MEPVGPATAAGTPGPARGAGRRTAVLFALAACAVQAALYAWEGNSYWSYSDGVYAYTSRALLDGAGLYRDVAAAQPPPTFWLGGLFLAPSDSIWMLRGALSVVGLAGGGLVALAVWRLTESRAAAVGGGLASLVAPWAVREHTVLTPETFVAPLLMAASLLATSRRRGAAVVGGAAAGLAGCFKVSWLISALALAIVARERRRFTAGAIAAVAFVAAVSLALYGQPLIDSVITAQFQLGRTPPRTVLEYLEQAAWNLTPLALPALLAVRLRSHARDPLLVRTLLALALSSAVGLVSLAKEGSFLNVLVPMEPPLVALSAAGLWALVVDARAVRAGARARLAVALAALLVAALQTAALLRSPDDPKLFRHPYAAAYYQRTLSGDQVDLEVRRSRRCPPRLATSESPFLAFIARRRLPGNQGDPFIVGRAKVLARFKALALRDRPRCPRRSG